MRFGKMLAFVFGIPKTLLFNFYYLPIGKAIKFPFIVAANTKIGGLGKRNSVIIENINKHISIGFGGSFALGGG